MDVAFSRRLFLKDRHVFRKDRHELSHATLWEARNAFMGGEEDRLLPGADCRRCVALPGCRPNYWLLFVDFGNFYEYCKRLKNGR